MPLSTRLLRASFTCTFALQRLALQTRQWFSVVTAALSGNSVSGIVPDGDAAGAGLQFELLSHAGFDTDAAVGALTTFSLLEVGALLALPVVALPAVLAGTAVSPGLVRTALLGLGMFCLLAIAGVVGIATAAGTPGPRLTTRRGEERNSDPVRMNKIGVLVGVATPGVPCGHARHVAALPASRCQWVGGMSTEPMM
jgi:hypothetical protein